jgi:hypothetical protein
MTCGKHRKPEAKNENSADNQNSQKESTEYRVRRTAPGIVASGAVCVVDTDVLTGLEELTAVFQVQYGG